MMKTWQAMNRHKEQKGKQSPIKPKEAGLEGRTRYSKTGGNIAGSRSRWRSSNSFLKQGPGKEEGPAQKVPGNTLKGPGERGFSGGLKGCMKAFPTKPCRAATTGK